MEFSIPKLLKFGEVVDKTAGTRRQFLVDLGRLALASTLICPIYTYHEVVNANSFAAFVISLLNSGNYPIKLSDVYNYFQTGEKSWPEDKAPFVLTFDDRLLSQKENALPFLMEWKLPADFCVMAPGWPGSGRNRYMTDSDLQMLPEQGYELVSHSVYHPNLPTLEGRDPGGWAAEIVESKSRLQDLTGQKIDFFCYPMGAYNRDTLDLVGQNYLAALSTRGGSLQSAEELLYLRRFSKS